MVERVVPWPAVALAKAAQRVGNAAMPLEFLLRVAQWKGHSCAGDRGAMLIVLRTRRSTLGRFSLHVIGSLNKTRASQEHNWR